MADGLDLVVHALDGSVGEAGFGPGKNSIQVGAQHLREFLERLQLGSHGRVHPLAQMLLSTPRLFVGPEQKKGYAMLQTRDAKGLWMQSVLAADTLTGDKVFERMIGAVVYRNRPTCAGGDWRSCDAYCSTIWSYCTPLFAAALETIAMI
jgi:hypothetical protein